MIPAIIVIPARMDSTRLPGKPLLNTTGKPLIQHTYEQALKSKQASAVWVVTDHKEIYDAVLAFGGNAYMNASRCANGTVRVADFVAVADRHSMVIVNWQGDEPELDPADVDRLIAHTLQYRVITTLCTKFTNYSEFTSRNTVKVVMAQDHALYFSREAIPHFDHARWSFEEHPARKHIGVYCFPPGIFNGTARHYGGLSLFSCSPYSLAEDLEQLVILEGGFKLDCLQTDHKSYGVDTPVDYDNFCLRHAMRLRLS